MIEPLALTLLSAAAGAALWKSSKFSQVAGGFALNLDRVRAHLRDERGSFSPLAERLEVRDFDGDTVETLDGWVWQGLRVRLVPTVGVGAGRVNEINRALNSVFAGAGEGARIQVVHEHRADARAAARQLKRLARHCFDPVWHAVLMRRAADLRSWAWASEISTLNSYVFVGLQARRKRLERVSPSHLFRPSPWVDMEEREFFRHERDVIQARRTLADYYAAAGGESETLSAEEIRRIIYRRMNRTNGLPAPAFDPTVSPREDLCLTDVEALRSGALHWADDTYSQTVSMRRQPKRVIAPLLETITRNERLNFDFDLAMHFMVGDWVKWERQLTTQHEVVAGNIAAAERKEQLPNLTEVTKEEQLRSVLTEIITGDEKLGVAGLSATAYADDPETLRERVERLQVAMRRCEGMTPIVNRRRAGLVQFITTLPCSPHKELHHHPCMTKDAAAYAALTGAPSGVPVEDATDVFLTSDNRPFYWRPDHPDFKSGMTAIFAGSGSGKSVILNRQRAGFLAAGKRGLTIDVGKSCARVVEAAGGQMVDVTDPLAARSLGFFRVRPEAGEHYTRDELTDEGLPRDRLGALEEQLETLALNPRRPDDYLSYGVGDALRKSLRALYRAHERGTPGMDAFLRVCEATTGGAAGEACRELVQRLSAYDSQSAYGRYFADDDGSAPLDINSPYTAFDLQAATKDPRLLLIATLGVTSYVGRFLSIDREVEKFLDADELHKWVEHPPVRRALDLFFRTARKRNVHLTAASQDPDDAVRDEFKALRSSCEVWWISGMRPSVAAASFDIGPAVADMIGRLKTSGHDYREWCLLYPEGQAAHLRVKMGALDGRLFMGASKGREKYTAEEAIAASGADLPPRLIRALHSSGTGERTAPVPSLMAAD